MNARADLSSTASVMPSRRALSALVSIGLMVVVICLVFVKTGFSTFSTLIAAFPIENLLLVSALLLIGAGLSAWRLKFIANDLGYQLTTRDVIAALGLGQAAGSIFFQVVGQLMARSALLARRGMPVAATVTMTVYERAAAAAVSLVLAISGGWYIFGRLTLDIQHGGFLFLEIAAGLLLAIAAGAWLGWGEKAFSASQRKFDRLLLLQILRNVAVGTLIQLATMGAYISAAHAFAPSVALLDLGAAAAVVMLAASLPISFAGWGVRELSAVIALGVIGVPSQAALMVAVLIGVVSLIVAGLFALASFWKVPHTPLAAPIGTLPRTDYAMWLAWSVPLLAATTVFFQLYVPIGGGELNVNLADPLAILGGTLFVLGCATERRLPSWRLSGFNLQIALMTLMVVIALLKGAAIFGWTPWALTNRFFGWFVLLGYVATGALLIRHSQYEGLKIILRTFAAVGASIVALDLMLIVLAQFGVNLPNEVLFSHISGFAQNPNAFAFQILLALCATLAADFPRRQGTLVTTLCFVGLWFADSRAAFVAFPIILAVAYHLRELSLRRVITATALSACVVFVIFLLPTIEGSATYGHFQIFHLSMASTESGDTERMTSLVGGLKLFLDHPVLGAGLGAFMESRLSASATPLVIHSTPLWLLAEFGLVGFTIFATPMVRVLFSEIKRVPSGDPAAKILILILVTLGLVSVFHELLYQRGFWLLFGAAMACVPGLAPQEYRGHAGALRIPADQRVAAGPRPDDNLDLKVARGFGWEWTAFRQDQDHLSRQQRQEIFDDYFQIFPWHLLLPGGGVGIDVGCGTGRWATLVAPRVAHLHLLDASPEALAVARDNLGFAANVSFHDESVAAIPLPSNSLDFAYALGVLHHVPDTQAAMDAIAGKLKPGAPFLLYLYYAFDNRPVWYRWLWLLSNLGRLVVSRLPHPLRLIVSNVIAALVYWPLARGAGVLSRLGSSPQSLPLAWYADKSFYVMRTDAYDRFCTRLERRFTRIEIEQMLHRAGFESVRFSDDAPFWCAVGIKASARGAA